MIRRELIQRFEELADRPALHTMESTVDYGELRSLVVDRVEMLTREGVAPGEIVFLDGDYSPENIALFLALYENGNIVAPNTVTTEAEAEDRIQSARCDIVIRSATGEIVRRSHPEEPHALVARLRADGRAGLVLFSSGTTGKPKVMLHDLDRLVESYVGKRVRSMNVLLFLLFDHIGGLNTLFNVFGMGGSATIPHERTPDGVAAIIEKRKVVVLPASPTFLNLMLVSGAVDRHDLGSLRMITYGTEPMPESLLLKLKERFPRVKLLQTFGTSETGIATTTSRSSDSLFMKIDQESMEHRIVDGELWLRSKRQILGYLNHSSESFTDDGWFKTGDLVDVDAEGYLRIKGRNREIMNVGGEKVFPAEVESVLLQLPFVADCKAYARPNALTGQSVCVDVVLKSAPEDQKELVRQIKSFARENMDPYKIPSRVNVVDRLEYSSRFKKSLKQETA